MLAPIPHIHPILIHAFASLPKGTPIHDERHLVRLRGDFKERRKSYLTRLSAEQMPRMELTYKSGRMGEVSEEQDSYLSSIKRWDGISRSSAPWDYLRRDEQDPELWYRNGNCTVHLYGQGQSRRGPAFKVPFSGLLAANCFPLVQRFIARDTPDSPSFDSEASPSDLELWSDANPTGRVELFIPAPEGVDRHQALRYHLATRNFFAWVFRRSVVGESLGDALVALLNSMHECRSADVDNVEDLMYYCDEEGYFDFSNQPGHSLAILNLAETFRLRDLYIDAFAHCVGMSDNLYRSPEYLHITSVSRKLIREARIEMNARLGHCGSLLQTFLEDDLSEAHISLAPGARAHLERFRSFLLGFYASKFGYYPPSWASFRSTMFEAQISQTMARDFESLYCLLVDQGFTKQRSPTLAQSGGICVLQSVESFDRRHNFKSLDHPLPLLPEGEPALPSKRMSWMPTRSWSTRGRVDPRQAAHTALVSATNKANLNILNNDLVRAYRKFEEDSVFRPLRSDRLEKISLVDARKVRWILVYAVHQTLRCCTAVPPEVCDVDGAPYHLAISTAALPPWGDEEPVRRPARSLSRPMHRSNSSLGLPLQAPVTPPVQPQRMSTYEIKPDIDYFALTHPEVPERSSSRFFRQGGPAAIPSRRQSLTRELLHNVSVRRPLRIFRSNPSLRLSQPPAPRCSVAALKAALLEEEAVLPAVGIIKTNRSPSTSSSASSSGSASTADSCGGRTVSSGSRCCSGSSSSDMLSGPQSPLTDYSASSPVLQYFPDEKALALVADGVVGEAAGRQQQTPPPVRRRTSSGSETDGSFYSAQGGDDDEGLGSREVDSPPPPAIPARSRRRDSRLFSVYSGSSPEMRNVELKPLPLRIRKDGGGGSGSAVSLMPTVEEYGGDSEEWERFADLGGLRPVAVPPV